MNRRFIPLLLLDGFVGMAIALFSFYHGLLSGAARQFPHFPQSSVSLAVSVFTFTNWKQFLYFGLPTFLSTITLSPGLIRHLSRNAGEGEECRYYVRSGLAGVVFGIIACSVTGFFVGVSVVILSFIEPQPGATFPVILGAPIYMFFMVGLVFPFLFFKEIVVGGIVFGLLNALFIRRLLTSQ